MDVKFDFKTPYFFLLSLFGVIFILSLSNIIKSNIVLYYSVYAILLCVIVWVISLDYDFKRDIIRNNVFECEDVVEGYGFGINGIFKVRQKMIHLQQFLILLLILGFVAIYIFF